MATLKRIRGGLALALMLTVSQAGSAAPEATVKDPIPEQPVGEALSALSRQTGLQIVYMSRVANGMRSVAIPGGLAPEEALRRLLGATGLAFEFLNERTVTIVPAAAESTASVGSGAGVQRGRMAGMNVAQAETSSSEAGKGGNEDQEGSSVTSDQATDVKKLVVQEIVVTAQRREQSIKDVPMSITALSGEDLRTKAIKNTLDLSFSVPGLFVTEYQPGSQQIFVRGVGSDRGGESFVGVYLDEIPLSGGADLRTKDLRRVEVLKGPQGTLFGEGSAGGTIRYITNTPKLDRIEGNIAGSYYGTQDGGGSYDVDGVLNLPVVEDKFGLRITGSFEDTGGWIDVVPAAGGALLANDVNSNRMHDFRVKGLWQPTEKLTVNGMVMTHRVEGDGQNVVNTEPRDRHEVVLPVSDGPTSGEFETEYKIANLSATYDLGFANLLNSTSATKIEGRVDGSVQVFNGNDLARFYAEFFAGINGVPPPGPNDPLLVEIVVDNVFSETKLFSEELRLTSSHGGPVNWVVGGIFKTNEAVSFSDGNDIVISGITISENGGASDSGVPSKSDSWAVYGDSTVQLPLGFEIGGGLRYFSKKIKFDTGSFTTDKLTFRALASYKPTDAVRLYASTSTGFRPGSVNSDGRVAQGAPREIQPETVEAYELGAKTSFFDGRVSADIALFINDYVDIQGDVLRTINGNPIQYSSNSGSTRIKGFEWSLGWRPIDAWRLSFNGEVLDAKFTYIDDSVPREVIPGDPVNFVPDYDFTIVSDYDFHWTARAKGAFHVGYSVRGPSHYTFRNNVALDVSDETDVLGFLSVGVEASWSDWTLTLFGRNLLGEAGKLSPGVTGILPQPRPRTVGITVSKAF